MREDILKTKLEKLENIKNSGMEPYPEKTDRTMENQEAVEKFDELSKNRKKVVLVGRIKSLRLMGNIAFCHLEDGTAKIQIFLNKKILEVENFKLFAENIEIGDFISASGIFFETKSGEKTLEVHDWKMISKNVRPIPTEYFGLKDEESLLRKRYLDLMMNPDTRELFRKKKIFWHTVRQMLVKEGFLEVQTPVLEHIPGGAEAEPFITHYNALNQDFFMRISLELPLKRLLVGGYEKVFEIGRVFRNEGMDRDHLQEFDHMEFYAAYWDFQKGMEFAEKLFREVVREVTGGMETVYEGENIDWNQKFPVVDYFEELKKETGIDLNDEWSATDLKKKADELGIKYEPGYSKARMIDTLYKRTVRQKLINPCFLIGHPLEVSPLAKIDPNNPKKVLRFQVVAGRSELCNAFSELNDPIDQKNRFLEQAKAREAGDVEAMAMDEDFVEALEYGMPPAFGFGFSERFFSFLMDRSIRECVIFPPVKEIIKQEGKSRETKIAVAIINKGVGMERWQEINTVAHLCASFASREGKHLLMQDEIITSDNDRIKLNIQHAIIIKEADSKEDIAKLVAKCKKNKITISEFTREMLDTTDDKKVIKLTSEKKSNEIEYLGVLLFGKKSSIEKLTEEYGLYQ
jgi:lysyl-tRNA synthetase, class II